MGAGNFEIEISGRLAGGLTLAEIRKNAAAMLKAVGWQKASLSLLLTSDREIRKINKKHLGHDYATDVITFGQLDEETGGPAPGGKPFLGDIVISLDTARRQAGQYGNTFKYEFYFYLCHGILHIAGFEDGSAAERGRMHRIQESILREIGIAGGGPQSAAVKIRRHRK